LVRRSLHICFDLLGAFLAGLALLIGFAAYRLSDGHPFHVGFLIPFVERSLAAPDGTFRVRIDDIIVTWTGGDRLIGLRALHVRALGADDRELASVPQIGISLSVSALVHGILAPTAVEIFEPRIHMRRNADGRFQFLATVEGPAAGQPSALLPEIFQELLSSPDPRLSTGYLRRAHLIGGTLEFDDRRTGLVWHAPKLDIDLMRDRQGIAGRISAQVAEFGDPALFDGDFSFDSATRRVSLDSHYSGLDIAALGLIVPDLVVLSGSHLQFRGSFSTSVNLDGHFGSMRFTVAGGPGSLDLQDHFAAPLPVTELDAAGEMKAGLDELRLDSFSLNLGGPVLSASAKVTGLISDHVPKSGKLSIVGHASIAGLPVPDLQRLWPINLGGADNARAWVVENIDQGLISAVDASFDVVLAGGDLNDPTVNAFRGTLKATGVGVHYYRPLPPIRGADGTASFDANKFTADFSSGGVGRIGIRRGHLVISGLQAETQLIDVEGEVHGPLKDALQLLDNPPLGYARKLDLKPADTAGEVETHLIVHLPAANHLKHGEFRLTAASHITGGRLGAIVLDRDLTDGDLNLQVNNDGMSVAGRARFADIPTDLHWNYNFTGLEPQSRIQVSAMTSAADLARLGFDYRSVVNGPLHLDLTYDEYQSGAGAILADFDLTPATVAIDFANWRKEPGKPGQAAMAVDMAGHKPTAIRSFRFSAGDFSGDGRARFGPDGKMAEATFDQITLAGTRLNRVVIGMTGPALDIHVASGVFDAAPFIEQTKPGGSHPAASPAPATEEKPTRPYALTADRLDRVLLGPNREIDAVHLAFAYDGLHWQALDARGQLADGKPITVRWQPASGGAHQLSIAAEDAGAALKALGIFDNVVGGHLAITGSASDADPKRAIKGHVEVSEYRLVRQSALLRLFSMALFTGLADALTGEGFQMYRFTADFTKTGGHIHIPIARTYGPSLGLTASGTLDFDTDSIDVRGTAIPSYSLNSLIGQIPLVGYLLTGGKGNGLFAVVYNATGKLSEPTISVDPLSALAPGFLRGVFGLSAPGETPSEPEAVPSSAGTPGKKS